jgi:hypothetical protein
MTGRFKEQMDKDAQQVNEELIKQIRRFTTMSEERIAEIAPEPADKEKLAQLLGIVNSATDENNKIALIKKNFDTLAGTIVNALKILAK